jgi:signal transduction histidine kinase
MIPQAATSRVIRWLSLVGGLLFINALITYLRTITARSRGERSQQLLSDVTTTLASSLTDTTSSAAIVNLVVPRLADLCVLFEVFPDGSARRTASAHVDPAKAEELRRLHPLPVNDDHPVYPTIRTGKVVLNPTFSEELLQKFANDEEGLKRIKSLIPRSQIFVPLIVKQRTIGALVFGIENAKRPPFNEADLVLAQEIAGRIALALDNSRLYQEAQAAVQVRDTFLSIAAHELKTPLTALLGQAQVLQRRVKEEGGLTPRNQRTLNVIVEQSLRLSRMIAALLDIRRIEHGQLTIEQVPLDLAALSRRVIDEIQPTLSYHEVVYTNDQPVMIVGDELRLEQVLYNLISNAAKYSAHQTTIMVEVQQQGTEAELRVRDEGMGIPEASIPHLFDRYYRVPHTQHHISGMGIGLYVVKEIISLHGGAIHVESVVGEGSCFTVRLPLA